MKKFITALILLLYSYVVQSQTINRLEYFVDIDKGVGKNTPVNVTASANGTFSFTVNLSGFSPGYHKLYIRAKDSKGNWSIASRNTIQVLPLSTKNIIPRGEYFFDVDPGFGNAKKINIIKKDSAITQMFTASVKSLSPGYHKLYMRTLDSYGSWSQTTRYNVQVKKATDTSYVVAVEYFFTTDAGVGDCPSIALLPSENGTFKFKIPKNKVPANAKVLFLRVRDSANNNWSLTQLDSLNNSLNASNLIAEQLKVERSFSIMPNPANSYFNLNLKGFDNVTNLLMIIKDVTGKTVITQKVLPESSRHIDVSRLVKGVYFITVTDNNFSSTQKLVIQ